MTHRPAAMLFPFSFIISECQTIGKAYRKIDRIDRYNNIYIQYNKKVLRKTLVYP